MSGGGAVTLNVPSVRFDEAGNVNDFLRIVVNDVDVARSGTPDSDLMFDAYTNQTLPTINFGNADLQVKKPVPLGTDERRGYLAVDLTQFSGWTAVGAHPTVLDPSGSPACLVLSVTASSTILALTQAFVCTPHSVTAKPFTESTVTWAAPPTLGTPGTGGNIDASPAPTRRHFGVSAADVTAALGKWLLFSFQVTAVLDLGVDTVTVVSRDSAVAADRPKFTLNYLAKGT